MEIPSDDSAVHVGEGVAVPVQSMRKQACSWLPGVVGSALIAVAVIRVVSTYPVFYQTYDQPVSVA